MKPSPEYIAIIDKDIDYLADRIDAIIAEMGGMMGNDLCSLATELGLAVYERHRHFKYRKRLIGEHLDVKL